ncbi:polysaccharide pyruvyl transferase family protein [Xanthobacter agilis]|uniref:polysaccharide pyruvyl transferase family protein n=1 Tax=Xanthobacter agilis TaxID=47492 RepID=UPI0037268DE1
MPDQDAQASPHLSEPHGSDRPEPIPLGWAGASLKADYLNFGDAMSPVMVALVGGWPVRRVAYESSELRLAAVGTIAHGFRGGEVHVWGAGCSRWANPSAPLSARRPYERPTDTRMVIHATRGPLSQRLLLGGAGGPNVFGDPVWLLPRFYRPQVKKKWALGVVLHLSDLADRAYEPHPLPEFQRYVVPETLAGAVRLITTVTPIDMLSLKAKVDEILACERIVSMSLHGLVIAEAYGIPCLYFAASGLKPGLGDISLDPETLVNPRIADLYGGLGVRRRLGYVQPRRTPTDWDDVIDAIDRAWTPLDLDGDRLMAAFPFGAAPLRPAPGTDIWSHPLVRTLQLQHDVAQLQNASKRKRTWPWLKPIALA